MPGWIATSADAAGALTILLLALLARTRGPLRNNSALIVGSVLSLSIGSLLVLVGTSNRSVEIACIGCILSTLGRSAFWLLWFELYGCLVPVKIALVYTASNVVCVLLWPVLSAAPARILAICMVALPLFSLLAYAVSWRTVPENHRPSPATSHPRAIRKLAVWVAALSLAYGICVHALAPVPSPSIAYTAHLLPNLLVVGGLLWASGRFDLDVIYRLSVPVLTAGCLLTAIPGMAHNVAYFTLEMGDELFSILFFVVACGASYRLHVSAAFLCGIVFFERISLGRV